MNEYTFEQVMQRLAAGNVRPLEMSEMELLLPLLSSFAQNLDRANVHLASGAVREAVRLAGGSTKLAREIKATRQSVNNWCKRGAPAGRCEDIEKATGVKKDLLLPLAKMRAKAAPATGIAAGEGQL